MGLMDSITGEGLYLDTNIFIYALEGYPKFIASVRALFAAIDEGRIRAVTSELTLAESLVKPMMDGNIILQKFYEDTLQSSEALFVAPITRQILINAARIRASSNFIRLLDAIHLATANECSCQTFLSNDKRLKAISDLNIIILSETGL